MASIALEPLPNLLYSLTESSTTTLSHSVQTVDSLLARLEQIRSTIQAGDHPGSLVVPLMGFTKTAVGENGKKHKEWRDGVGAFGKSVDKVGSSAPTLGCVVGC